MGVGTKELTLKSPLEAMERKGDEPIEEAVAGASCGAAGDEQTPGNLPGGASGVHLLCK